MISKIILWKKILCISTSIYLLFMFLKWNGSVLNVIIYKKINLRYFKNVLLYNLKSDITIVKK